MVGPCQILVYRQIVQDRMTLTHVGIYRGRWYRILRCGPLRSLRVETD